LRTGRERCEYRWCCCSRLVTVASVSPQSGLVAHLDVLPPQIGELDLHIVPFSSLVIAEDVVRLLDAVEFLCRFGLLALVGDFIGVAFESEFPVSGFDEGSVCGLGHA